MYAAGDELAGFPVERRLGRGGMGEVYLVRHPRLQRLDALKVLREEASADPHYVERFQREALLAARLDHDNVLPVYDCGEAGGQLWIHMKYVRRPGRRGRAAQRRAVLRPPRRQRGEQGGVRARPRAQPRAAAPRREAGQHPARPPERRRPARARVPVRLRHRQAGRRRCRPHARRALRRKPRLRGPRADPDAGARRPGRSVRTRLRRLPAAHRLTALPGRGRLGQDERAPGVTAAQGRAAAPGAAAGRPVGHRPGTGEVAGGPLRQLQRDGQGTRGLAAGAS